MTETISNLAAREIAQLREERHIEGHPIMKLFVGVTVHEQHEGGPLGDPDAPTGDLQVMYSGLQMEARGGLSWYPWVALVADPGRKKLKYARFPMSTGHDVRGIGRILADKPNFFAFEHHSGNVLFTITADQFFSQTGESDWR
jgi:hypothetical protein